MCVTGRYNKIVIILINNNNNNNDILCLCVYLLVQLILVSHLFSVCVVVVYMQLG